MPIRQLHSFLSIAAITLAGTVLPNTSAFAQKATFVCGTSQDGFPATIVKSTHHGEVTIIKWSSNYFEGGGYDNQTRCNIVSQRFQKYSDRGSLKYITDGKVNRQPVLCVVPARDGICNSDNILWTLKPSDNSQEKLQKLFDIRAGATGSALEETISVKSQDRISIDFAKFMEKKVREASNSSVDLSPMETESSPTEDVSNKSLF